MTLTIQGSRIGVASAISDWWDGQWALTNGCTKFSDGCQNCAAAIMTARSESFQRYATLSGSPHLANWTGVVDTLPGSLKNLPTTGRVFVNSFSDLFHDRVPDEFLDQVFDAMARSPATFGVLTKRSERMSHYLRDRKGGVPDNAWVGVTIESPKYLSRLVDLLDVSARVRWVSAEPLLDELSLAQWLGPNKINWIVAGPEIGVHARPCMFEWMQRLREECRIAGVPYFTKHLLSGREIREYPDAQS